MNNNTLQSNIACWRLIDLFSQPLKGQLGFEGNWCRKNKHTISSVSSAICVRFRSTKYGTSTRIWTWYIILPKCMIFWRARQNRVLKGEIYSVLYFKGADRICPLWKFECGRRRQDKNCHDKICPSILLRQFQFCPQVRIGPYWTKHFVGNKTNCFHLYH